MVEILTKVDKKILYLLNMNSRLPYTKIAKLIGASREVVEYRVKRLVELGIITRFSTVISSARLGNKTYHMLIKYGNSSEDEEKSFIKHLELQKYTRYVGCCRGNYDLYYVFTVRNNQELSYVIDEINEKSSGIIQQKELLIPIKPLKYPECPFFIKVKYETRNRPTQKDNKMDSIDKGILNQLRENSRITFEKLGKELNVPPETIRYKFNKLMDVGIIKDFNIRIDTDKLGYVSYNLFLKLHDYSYKQDNKTIAQLYEEPFLLSANRVVGKYDIILEVLCKNSKEFEEQLSRLKKFFKNTISNYEIAIKLRSFHNNKINWEEN